jgi:hypothetical protein
MNPLSLLYSLAMLAGLLHHESAAVLSLSAALRGCPRRGIA